MHSFSQPHYIKALDPFQDIVAEASQAWREMDEEARKPYKEKATLLSEQYKREMQQWEERYEQ